MKVGLQNEPGRKIAFVDGEFARNAISGMKATRIQRNLKLLTAARSLFPVLAVLSGAALPAVVSVFTPREPPVLAYPPFHLLSYLTGDDYTS